MNTKLFSKVGDKSVSTGFTLGFVNNKRKENDDE
jgi:hypothetical protein